MVTTMSAEELVAEIATKEKTVLKELALQERLKEAVATENGIIKFAEAFYSVRYDFCRLNFIVGERCCNNEVLWSGIAKNLYEELGGKSGLSHNQLYRNFLSCVGARQEGSFQDPEFARRFNLSWEVFCRQSSIEEALLAIAIYEIFDVPDYQLLLEVMDDRKVPKKGLTFFKVHAVSEHFSMFEDTVAWLKKQEGGEKAFVKAKNFVFQTQTRMWKELLDHLAA
ncbi:MAG: iron-containing redox enzyme family protein [Cyanobacteria bacterium J06627_32]